MGEARDQFALESAIRDICLLIEKKENLNTNYKEDISCAQDYLCSLSKTLDSMIGASVKLESAYHFTPFIKEFIESAGKKTEGFSNDDAFEVGHKAVSLNYNLNALRRNPRAFYELKDSQETLEFFRKFLPKIETKYKPVFSTYETFEEAAKDLEGDD